VSRATTYEIVNDGSPSVFALYDGIVDGSAARRLIGQSLNFYDGPAFQGLPFGHIGDYGALVRTETLVLDEQLLHDAYKSGSDVLTPPEEPPYLSSGVPTWTTDYPAEFRALLPAQQPLDPTRPGLQITPAGYGFASGDDGNFARGYFVATQQCRYDFQQSRTSRGLPTVMRDPLGHQTSVAYDHYDLLPVEITDPAGLTVRSAYDYRVLQPREVTDPNSNRTAFTYTPLGLLESTSVMGKTGESLGDTATAPSSRLVYDLLAFADPVRRQPVSVRTIRRVHHANEIDLPLPQRNETVEMVEYSDGFGRLLQTRTQSEDVNFGDSVFGGDVLSADQTITPGDAVGHRREEGEPSRVVVSGWQVYDNKGQLIEKYEPFFSAGWEYSPPSDRQRGQKAMMYYDPRGQVIRTVNPDGSMHRVIHGVPGSIGAPHLTNPELFEPTPWESYTYDPNDNAGRTHAVAAASYRQHWNTPSSVIMDALGRVVENVERNGSSSSTDWYITRSGYDIRGNLLTVTDALGRVAFRHVYDLANKPLRIENIDAGLHRIVLNAGGEEVERRDSKGALILHAYDVLSRPVRLWARDGVGQALTLRECLIYGDSADSGLTVTRAQSSNLLGKPHRHYDEAGLLSFEAYDFNGNVLEKTRQLISDAAILAVFNPPPANWELHAFRMNWQSPDGTTLNDHARGLLDVDAYQTSFTYDALNRVKTMRYPHTVDGARKLLRPRYNRAGALDQVEVDEVIYVDQIAYNAKGQRTFIAYGNGVMTRYAYDPQTFLLRRLRTERHAKPAGATLTYRSTAPSDPLQDFACEYDLSGNLLALHDRTPGAGLPAQPDRLDRIFTYDSLYRLLSATGRECDLPPSGPPWLDEPRCADLTRTRSYTEGYQYDPLGNIARLQHHSDGSFTRDFAFTPGSNRLATVTIGSTVYDYVYDPNGNLIREASSRHFEWDHSDRMRVYRTQTAGAEPSVHAHYFYDAAGQRAKKLVRKQGGRVETTVYVDGIFEHHRVVAGGVAEANNTLHVMDDQRRIGTVRVGVPFDDDRTPAVKYHLADHIGSSNLVIDHAGTLTNREEYTPYGETSFGSFGQKRYRFTGKERYEESGLYYHEARYYAPSLARWVSCDPEGIAAGINPFQYTQGNPLRFHDPSGRDPLPTNQDLDNIERGLTAIQPALTTISQQAQAAQGQVTRLTSDINAIPSGIRNTALQNLLDPIEFGARAQLRTIQQIESNPDVASGASLVQQLRNYSTALQQQIVSGMRTAQVGALLSRVSTLLNNQATQAVENIQYAVTRANQELQRLGPALAAYGRFIFPRGPGGGTSGGGQTSGNGGQNQTNQRPPQAICAPPPTVGRRTSTPWWVIGGAALLIIGRAVIEGASRTVTPVFIMVSPDAMRGAMRGNQGQDTL